jgi:hypothetical protein
MNKEKWEQTSEDLKPLLKQLSDIAEKHEFGEDILSISVDGTGYVSICLINDKIQYSLNRLNKPEEFKIMIMNCRQETKP